MTDTENINYLVDFLTTNGIGGVASGTNLVIIVLPKNGTGENFKTKLIPVLDKTGFKMYSAKSRDTKSWEAFDLKKIS